MTSLQLTFHKLTFDEALDELATNHKLPFDEALDNLATIDKFMHSLLMKQCYNWQNHRLTFNEALNDASKLRKVVFELFGRRWFGQSSDEEFARQLDLRQRVLTGNRRAFRLHAAVVRNHNE